MATTLHDNTAAGADSTSTTTTTTTATQKNPMKSLQESKDEAVLAQWTNLGANAIRDVWATNLDEEFRNIREAIQTCPFVALDTEFPGIVARPLGNFRTTHEFYYQTLRCNVNILKIIQLGITLCDAEGRPPAKGPSTWQFNFRFCLGEDIYAEDSIILLTSSGIDFGRFEREGVDLFLFAQLMTSSGLVLCPNVQWLSFHAGYDFGYIVKALTNQELPEREAEFFEVLRLYFPTIYDIKYVLKETDYLSHQIGLDSLADATGVRRIGPAHQAGSDSLLTALCFFKLLREYSAGEFPASTRGVLYGLGEDYATSSTPLVGSSNTLAAASSTFPTAPARSTATSSATTTTATATTTTTTTASGASSPPSNAATSTTAAASPASIQSQIAAQAANQTIANTSRSSPHSAATVTGTAPAAVAGTVTNSSSSSSGTSSAYINSVVYHGMAPPGKAVTHNQHGK